MRRLCQLFLTLALGAGLVGPALGSDKERSEEQNHKYGFFPHSELLPLMHPHLGAAGFVLVEANYARGRCDSVSVLETSFFTPSKRFERRIDRVLNEACEAAGDNSSISQKEETHLYQISLFGKRTYSCTRRSYHNKTKSWLWNKTKSCKENLEEAISRLDPSSDFPGAFKHRVERIKNGNCSALRTPACLEERFNSVHLS